MIPVEPEGDPAAALRALRQAWPQGLRGEALVARGRQPSLQRNAAVAQARGELVYFLDSDSLAQPGSIAALIEELEDAGVAGAGGPNLPRLDEPWLGRVFSLVLASRLGSGASRARYAAVGRPRDCGEKELILCNLMLRRRAYLEAGGLRADLYPNEENELLNRLQDAGWRLRCRPAAPVRRPRRGSVAAFAWQAFRYGRGRMQQMRVNLHRGDLVQLAPAFLLAYTLAAPWLASRPAALLPLAVYLAGAAATAAAGAWRLGDLRAFPLAWALLPLRHLAYGAGLAAGLVQAPRQGASTVRLERHRMGGRR